MRLDRFFLFAAMSALSLSAVEVRATTVKSKAQEIKLTGRVQMQFNTTSVEDELGAEFLLRRVRFAAEVKMNDLVSGKIEPDYGEGKATLKDAYMKLKFGDSFAMKFGQFKRSFDLFQLTSSTKILVIERALKIRGVEGLRSYSSLSEKLQYADHDVGIAGTLRNKSRSLSGTIMISNGIGANKVPSKEEKSQADLQYSGRFEWEPMEERDLTVGINGSYRPYLLTTTTSSHVEALEPAKRIEDSPVLTIESDISEEYSLALGFDVEMGSFSDGPLIRAGVIWGENWSIGATSDPDTTFSESTRTIRVTSHENADNPPKFFAGQVIATYKHLLDPGGRVEAIGPVLRVSYADPDNDTPDDGGILITPGIQTFFTGRNKISLNVDIFLPESEEEETEYSFKAQTYLYF